MAPDRTETKPMSPDFSALQYGGRSLSWKPKGLDKFREPANGFMHLAGLLLSALATAVLIWRCYPDAGRMFSTAVFGISMCGCFLASTLHHLVRSDARTEIRLLKIDHAAIYPFIAGSYTPICLHVLPAPQGHILLVVVWAIALAGVAYKLFLSADPRSVADPPGFADTLMYFLMGCLVAGQLPGFIENSRSMTVWLAVIGGFAYAAGALILTRKLLDFWPGRFGHHEIWHVCVLLGASFMYSYVFLNLA